MDKNTEVVSEEVKDINEETNKSKLDTKTKIAIGILFALVVIAVVVSL